MLPAARRSGSLDMRATAVLVLSLFLTGGAAAQEAGAPLDLRADVVRLDTEDRERIRVGRLVWRGGLELVSGDRRFGGLSGLRLSDDATRAFAIADEGRWVEFSLRTGADGSLTGVGDGRIGAIAGRDGGSLGGEKVRGDAEGLAALPDGTLLISFERDHRLNRYAGWPPVAAPEAVPAPPGHTPQANEGMEALTALPDGRLLAMSEGLTAERDGATVWQGMLAADASAPDWQAFHLPQDSDLAPVAARPGPDGRYLYWLERGYSMLAGLRVKLKRAPLALVQPGALLQPEELAFLKAPLTLDNFEGLWLHRGSAGETLVTLLSDDNYSGMQRTLLVRFELAE